MEITLRIPEKYSDVLSLTMIGTETEDTQSVTCVRSITFEIRGKDGQVCTVPEFGRESWENRQQEQTGDFVSRQEVLDIIDRYQPDIERGDYRAYSDIWDEIDNL